MKKAKELKVLFAGDFAPCRRYEKFILEGQDPLSGVAHLVESADLSFVNVECPLTLNEEALPKSGPNIKASPKCAKVLHGFTLAGLANNHVLDYKDDGVVDTIDALNEVGIDTVGAGKNIEEARNIYFKTINDVCIAIIAVAEQEFNIATNDTAGCAPLDAIDNFKQLSLARESADIVIITIHGGNEYLSIPRPGLRKLCRFFADNGADAVICHHPHVPGGYEVYNDKLIAYSLGNFIFDRENAPAGWEQGYIVELLIDIPSKAISGFEFHPYNQSIQLGGVILMSEDTKRTALTRLESLREIIENDEQYFDTWNSFVSKNADSVIANYYLPFIFRGIGFLNRNFGLSKLLMKQPNRWARVNMVRCPSHSELLVSSLNRRSEY